MEDLTRRAIMGGAVALAAAAVMPALPAMAESAQWEVIHDIRGTGLFFARLLSAGEARSKSGIVPNGRLASFLASKSDRGSIALSHLAMEDFGHALPTDPVSVHNQAAEREQRARIAVRGLPDG